MILYSIGTSNRTATEFFEALHVFGIETIVDVRSRPTSRFEHFDRSRFEPLAHQAGLDYRYMGDRLGGYRKGGYEAYTKTADYGSSVDHLEEIARSSTTALVCAERDPQQCHRRFIGRTLRARGWRVCHILESGRLLEEEQGELFE